MFQSSFHIQFPERNSSLKHYRILCCSNQPHLSLTGILSRCIITLIQEEPATLRQPQCTENQNLKVHTLATCPIFRSHLRTNRGIIVWS